MNSLIQMLADDGCRGVARSGDGRLAVFAHSGVADLFALVTDNPSFLDGASVADRVIGRGAALLLVLGRVWARGSCLRQGYQHRRPRRAA